MSTGSALSATMKRRSFDGRDQLIVVELTVCARALASSYENK